MFANCEADAQRDRNIADRTDSITSSADGDNNTDLVTYVLPR